MKRLSITVGAATLALLAAQGASAHVGIGGAGLGAGFAHPFLGLDHVLAMVAVGLWAAQSGGRAMWAVPATFVTMLAGGALLAIAGVNVPSVETGIAVSVLVLGLLVALAVRLPLAAGMVLTAAFAVFHGHSHGTEMPAMISPALYAAGFLVATALLHLAGVALGRGIAANRLRIAGACVALAGAWMVVGG